MKVMHAADINMTQFSHQSFNFPTFCRLLIQHPTPYIPN